MLDLNIILKSRFYYGLVTVVCSFYFLATRRSSGSLSWRILSGFHAGIEEPAGSPGMLKETLLQLACGRLAKEVSMLLASPHS